MNTKDDFHRLIDKIQDEEALKGYFKLIQRLSNHTTGELWDSLSPEQKQELLLAYEESKEPNNLISHDEVVKKHNKWLEK